MHSKKKPADANGGSLETSSHIYMVSPEPTICNTAALEKRNRRNLKFKLSLLALLGAMGLHAQFPTYLDASNASKTTPWRVLFYEPGVCANPEVYYNLQSGKLRVCGLSNTWVDLVSSGGTGVASLTVNVSSIPWLSVSPSTLSSPGTFTFTASAATASADGYLRASDFTLFSGKAAVGSCSAGSAITGTTSSGSPSCNPFAPPTSGSAPLKGNGLGGFSNLTASDIASLYTGCSSGSPNLKYDGTCGTGGGGTGASATSQLTDLYPVKSGTTLTIGNGPTPCGMVTGSPTITLTSGSGTAYIWISCSTLSPVLHVGVPASGLSLTCTGLSCTPETATSFPVPSLYPIPVATVQATSGAWGTISEARPWLSSCVVLTSGANITATYTGSGGNCSYSISSTGGSAPAADFKNSGQSSVTSGDYLAPTNITACTSAICVCTANVDTVSGNARVIWNWTNGLNSAATTAWGPNSGQGYSSVGNFTHQVMMNANSTAPTVEVAYIAGSGSAAWSIACYKVN